MVCNAMHSCCIYDLGHAATLSAGSYIPTGTCHTCMGPVRRAMVSIWPLWPLAISFLLQLMLLLFATKWLLTRHFWLRFLFQTGRTSWPQHHSRLSFQIYYTMRWQNLSYCWSSWIFPQCVYVQKLACDHGKCNYNLLSVPYWHRWCALKRILQVLTNLLLVFKKTSLVLLFPSIG